MMHAIKQEAKQKIGLESDKERPNVTEHKLEMLPC